MDYSAAFANPNLSPTVCGRNPTACVAECPENFGEGRVGDFASAIILKRPWILLDFSFRSLPLREHRRGQGSRRKPLRGEGESPMSHNVARHSYCSTALLNLSHGIAASQWICRAPARDAGKASSYQQFILKSKCLLQQFK